MLNRQKAIDLKRAIDTAIKQGSNWATFKAAA